MADLTYTSKTNDPKFYICASCRTYVFPEKESIVFADIDEFERSVTATEDASGYVTTLQLNNLTQIRIDFPDGNAVPLCDRCEKLLRRFLAAPHSGYPNGKPKKGVPRRRAARQRLPTHPIYEVIQFIANGGAGECREKRNLTNIMRNLCKRIIYPDGRIQYNELVLSGPRALQHVVKWVHERRVLLTSAREITQACAASYWMHNSFCVWGRSRDSMRAVRGFRRRMQAASNQVSSEPNNMALVSAL
jgi:hypothetical protein